MRYLLLAAFIIFMSGCKDQRSEAVTAGNSDTSSIKGNAYVRCVYDEWYWTDTVNKGDFTWGDKQR